MASILKKLLKLSWNFWKDSLFKWWCKNKQTSQMKQLTNMVLWLLDNFHFFCRLLNLIFEKSFKNYHQSVKQFGSWSGPTFCWAWSMSKLVARVISRRHKEILFMYFGDLYCKHFEPSQQAHSLKTTSYQRRCDVMTSHRRCWDIVLTLCACWDDDTAPWFCYHDQK